MGKARRDRLIIGSIDLKEYLINFEDCTINKLSDMNAGLIDPSNYQSFDTYEEAKNELIDYYENRIADFKLLLKQAKDL
ncbi:hypothetical protein [Flammeovirga sp. SJP92]|uniref:hypothetical protein n=1 Tax=Flammeovirga sp. SJP92 TaxID=1775430 RepID=UPI0007888790|nr:hypothetical protein [Flammeovirga sp. SJP92]KXX72750.1 hypothetical protein AVL50_32130 [Flammeovirga sp. SJP92]